MGYQFDLDCCVVMACVKNVSAPSPVMVTARQNLLSRSNASGKYVMLETLAWIRPRRSGGAWSFLSR